MKDSEGVSLREFNQRIDALEAHLGDKWDSAWEAHHREHVAAERTQTHTNELLNDVRVRFIPREVYEGQVDNIESSISKLGDRMGQLEGRFLGIGLAATMLGAVALVVSLVNW